MLRGAHSVMVMALAGFLGASACVVGCSLGLDESLIAIGNDGGGIGVDAGVVADAAGEASVDAGPSELSGSDCTNDDVCKTDRACLVGTCDLTRRRCTYDVCRAGTCSASACDPNARTCGAPKTYAFESTKFDVGAAVSCLKCVAAIHPWLFVATGTGVVAFNVSDPTNPAPAQVPVVGLEFNPGALVQSGSRVWMTGGMSGDNPSRRQLAYIDAPADPFATQIVAHTVVAGYDRPVEPTFLFARGGDSALLVGPSTANFPATVIDAPLTAPVSLKATPLVADATASGVPVASSGHRLLMAGFGGDGSAKFNLIDGAGSATPTSAAVVNLTDASPVSNQRELAQTPDGAIFWATGVHRIDGVNTFTRAARGYFLVPSDTGSITAAAGVDIEVYGGDPVGANAAVFGPGASVAMLDANTVMIATQARENAATAVVQFVKREPLGVVKEADGMKPRRQVLPIPIGTVVGAVADHGFGYLVANDHPTPSASATVYVFDPGCAP